MKNKYTTSDMLFIGFGILTMICGLFLVLQKDYISGIAGSCVGALIAYQNIKKIKEPEVE